MAPQHRFYSGSWLLTAIAAISLIAAVVEYFVPGNGIEGSLGVLIVIGSTLLMVLASAAIAAGYARGGLRALLMALILLDIIGSGFAAYMLDSTVLMALMGLALLAWLFAIFSAGPARQLASAEAAS